MWLETKNSPLVEMLSKLANLHQKIVTLQVLQMTRRAEQQVTMLSRSKDGLARVESKKLDAD